MIRICKESVQPEHLAAVTVLVDSFGTKFIVQSHLLEGDHAADVSKAMAEMQAREDAIIEKLKAAPFNYSDEKIARLQKSPKDCGCS